jgi:hypothetical protein
MQIYKCQSVDLVCVTLFSLAHFTSILKIMVISFSESKYHLEMEDATFCFDYTVGGKNFGVTRSWAVLR